MAARRKDIHIRLRLGSDLRRVLTHRGLRLH